MTGRNCFLIAGGGTGGHLTPGLAVAAELLKSDPDCRIVFAGADRPLEHSLVLAAGYERHALPSEPLALLRRRPLRFVYRNWKALRMAAALIAAEQPRAVIGLGAFASVPVVWAASRRRIPTLILEQNVIPGRATRFLSRRVDAVCTAFDATAAALKRGSHVIVTGNPVRREIAGLFAQGTRELPAAPPTLLVLGGSQGAQSLNDAVLAMFSQYLPQLTGWRVVHQTGAAQCDELARSYAQMGLTHVVKPFFDDLASWYAKATLAISRAGATTLAELACAGCPAVLVPYPHAADHHQLLNARHFEAAGAATVIEHGDTASATASRLAEHVDRLTQSTALRAEMRGAMLRQARPDAVRNVLAALQSLAPGLMR